jgi:hypothetical protein
MKLETVESSAIHAIGYDAEHWVLEIIFTGGGIYHFHHVPPSIYRGFAASRSKGSYFQDRIRGRFRHERLGRFRQRRRAQTTHEYQRA